MLASEEISGHIELLVDEIQALSSIYGDSWHVESEAGRTYEIRFNSHGDVCSNLDTFLCLRLKLPHGYPTSCSPICELSGPFLTPKDKVCLTNLIDEVCEKHLGSPIIHLLIEGCQEYLRKAKRVHSNELGEHSENSSNLSQANKKTDSSNDQGPHSPKIISGEPFSDRKSTFQGHIASVSSKADVETVLDKLLENKKVAAATHNIYAYRIKLPNECVLADCADDGEKSAGGRLLLLLEQGQAENVIIIVTRWYGGIHLGSDRFRHINNRARILLQQEGFLRQTNDRRNKCKKK